MDMTTSWDSDAFRLEEYNPPEWAKHFQYIPKYRLKVRKLDFFLADALQKRYKDIITTGTVSSNHCQVTVIAGAQVGLRIHLVLRSKNSDKTTDSSNLLPYRISGARTYLVNQEGPLLYIITCLSDNVKRKIEEIANNVRSETGKEAYIIALGGTGSIGVFEYIDSYNEMIEQGLLENITHVFVCCGSVGTLTGLAIANHIVSCDKIRVHGVVVAELDKQSLYKGVRESIDFLGIKGVDEKKILYLYEEYLGNGHETATPEQLGGIFGLIRNDLIGNFYKTPRETTST